jgi:hypothetical protein
MANCLAEKQKGQTKLLFNLCNIEVLFLKVKRNRRPEIQIQSIIIPLLQISFRAVGRVRFLYLAIDLCYIPLRFMV